MTSSNRGAYPALQDNIDLWLHRSLKFDGKQLPFSFLALPVSPHHPGHCSEPLSSVQGTDEEFTATVMTSLVTDSGPNYEPWSLPYFLSLWTCIIHCLYNVFCFTFNLLSVGFSSSRLVDRKYERRQSIGSAQANTKAELKPLNLATIAVSRAW
jgi:hypothetical protein